MTITQRAAKVGMTIKKPHRRVIDGELRMCAHVSTDGENWRIMTWKDMLTVLKSKELHY